MPPQRLADLIGQVGASTAQPSPSTRPSATTSTAMRPRRSACLPPRWLLTRRPATPAATELQCSHPTLATGASLQRAATRQGTSIVSQHEERESLAMTTSTTIRTRKRPRRARLLAMLTGPLLALGLIAGTGTASAAPSKAATTASDPTWPWPSGQLQVGGSGNTALCTFTDWGGTFYCDSPSYEPMPNGYVETFVIGTNHAVWTRWSSSSGLSSWKSLGGTCLNPLPNYIGEDTGIDWTNPSNGWNWIIECVGAGGHLFFKERVGSAAGSWTAWYD